VTVVDHERTVTIARHDDDGTVAEEFTVTPEVARAKLRHGFTVVSGKAAPSTADVEDRIALAVEEATEPLKARIAELENGGDPVPEKVEDIKAWVEGGTAARARAALEAEQAGQARTTLIAHLEGVLNPSAGDGEKEA
jgi:hypothetical protein